MGLGGRKLLIVDIPDDGRGFSEGGKIKAKGTSRNSLGMVDMEVGEGGGLGFSN